MKPMQASFAAGEISPLLHARVDMAKYATAVKKLENFIVLPQGGIMRRSNIQGLSDVPDDVVRLIPFHYNSEDTVMLAFGTNSISMYTTTEIWKDVFSMAHSYDAKDIMDLRWAQNGNVIFLVHPKYKIYTLTRHAMDDWTLEAFTPKNVPAKANSNKQDEEASVKVKSGIPYWNIEYTAVRGRNFGLTTSSLTAHGGSGG